LARPVPALAQSFRVVTYDRRGHSESERPPAQGSRREDEDDLSTLMEALGCVPAHVAGNSFGASIALGLAARRPELFRSVSAHEPPLLATVADDAELQPLLQDIQAKVGAVLEQLGRGDIEGGTRRFMEEVALGPGSWEQLPEPARAIAMNNAPTFLDEMRDPDWASLNLTALSSSSLPVLLTQGDQSPRWFWSIIAKLGQSLKDAKVMTIPGAGHVPHQTHPGDYAAILTDFIRRLR
jgi:pimeloyl-ACP methyl ester carboxylesterase